MGGGDLNLKKSWHPHTLKNQERVWKAEQQKAAEDRKMAELQRELKEEREREMLRRTAEESGAVEKKGDAKLDWMYKGPGGHVSREEYLLGRKIDTAFEQLQKEEAEEKTGCNDESEVSQQNKPVYTIEHEINPESVVRRESANIQVDMRRKLLEDPLLLIRQREEQAKREITSNPVKMKHLQQLISTIKSKKKKKKNRRKKHSRHDSPSSSSNSSSSSESDSEDDRSRKKKKNKTRRKALSSSASSSSSSSSDSSEERKRKKKKLKKNKSHKKHKEKGEKHHGNNKQEENSRNRRDNIATEERIGKLVGSFKKNCEPYRSQKLEDYSRDGRDNKFGRERDRDQRGHRNSERSRVHEGSEDRFRNQGRNDRYDRRNQDRYGGDRYGHSRSHRRSRSRSQSRSHSRSQSREWGRYGEGSRASDREKVKRKLSETEMEMMRQEMMNAARKRDEDRKENVKRYEEERRKEEEMEKDVSKFRRGHLLHAASRGTVEDRVKSRVSSVQRGSSHMEMNFARK